MSSPSDLYVVLAVVRTASVSDIKRAFRKLARRYHPDINPGDRSAEEHFKRISEAYDVLSDPAKREFYDQHGFYTDPPLSSPNLHATWGFSFKSFTVHGGRPQAGGVFEQFFSRQASRRGPEPGQDVEYQTAISFADSISGLKTRISVQRRHACIGCSGSGRAAPEHSAPCPACSGSGKMTRVRGRLQFSAPCEECAGAGRVATECSDCAGEGRTLRTDILEVEIPAGVSAGSRVRMTGKGDAGRYGGPAGDLYVITNVASHHFFNRAGDNIHCTLPVTFVEAALGSKVDVPTIDGKTVVRIPPGTQNGQVLRLREKGAPSLVQPGMRGDQFVEIRIVVPRVADERSREILKEFAVLNREDIRKDIWKV